MSKEPEAAGIYNSLDPLHYGLEAWPRPEDGESELQGDEACAEVIRYSKTSEEEDGRDILFAIRLGRALERAKAPMLTSVESVARRLCRAEAIHQPDDMVTSKYGYVAAGARQFPAWQLYTRLATAIMPQLDEEDYLWKWVERGLFDSHTSAKNALECLAHFPSAPWKRYHWDVSHKPYARAFYESFPDRFPPNGTEGAQ